MLDYYVKEGVLLILYLKNSTYYETSCTWTIKEYFKNGFLNHF